MSNIRELSCRVAHILDLHDCVFMINIRIFSYRNLKVGLLRIICIFVSWHLIITNINVIPFHSVTEHDLSGEIK